MHQSQSPPPGCGRSQKALYPGECPWTEAHLKLSLNSVPPPVRSSGTLSSPPSGFPAVPPALPFPLHILPVRSRNPAIRHPIPYGLPAAPRRISCGRPPAPVPCRQLPSWRPPAPVPFPPASLSRLPVPVLSPPVSLWRLLTPAPFPPASAFRLPDRFLHFLNHFFPFPDPPGLLKCLSFPRRSSSARLRSAGPRRRASGPSPPSFPSALFWRHSAFGSPRLSPRGTVRQNAVLRAYPQSLSLRGPYSPGTHPNRTEKLFPPSSGHKCR